MDAKTAFKLRAKALWAVAWRNAVTVTVIAIVAYLGVAYGYTQGLDRGFVNGVRACFMGHPACSLSAPQQDYRHESAPEKDQDEWQTVVY